MIGHTIASGMALWALVSGNPMIVCGVIFIALAVAGIVAWLHDAVRGMEDAL